MDFAYIQSIAALTSKPTSTPAPAAQQYTSLNRCVFNCGFCQVGQNHHCRKCGAINQHRSIDCPTQQDYKSQPTYSPMIYRSISSMTYTNTPTTYSSSSKDFSWKINGSKRFVALYLIKDNHLLMQYRGSSGLSNPNKIATPGGSADGNEAPLDAAYREFEEETGLNVKYNTSLIYSDYNAFTNRKNEKCEVYTFFMNYSGKSQWLNDGSGSWECDEFPENVHGINACHGHKWINQSTLTWLIGGKSGLLLLAAKGMCMEAIKHL